MGLCVSTKLLSHNQATPPPSLPREESIIVVGAVERSEELSTIMEESTVSNPEVHQHLSTPHPRQRKSLVLPPKEATH
jgi:hypothetical protein